MERADPFPHLIDARPDCDEQEKRGKIKDSLIWGAGSGLDALLGVAMVKDGATILPEMSTRQ